MRTRNQIQAVVDLVSGVFGSDLVGAYLHGPAALGGLRPTSDVDVLAVCRRASASEERRTLLDGVAGHLREAGASGPRATGRAHGRRAVRGPPWRYPPTVEFQYGEWLRDDYERV